MWIIPVFVFSTKLLNKLTRYLALEVRSRLLPGLRGVSTSARPASQFRQVLLDWIGGSHLAALNGAGQAVSDGSGEHREPVPESPLGMARAWCWEGWFAQTADHHYPSRVRSPSSRGLGLRPFTAATRVRIPLGMPRRLLSGVPWNGWPSGLELRFPKTGECR